MTTDFGGFMLIGKTNSSVTWTIPSRDNPVEPYGDPQWASHLGDAPILDFRIQISAAEDLSKTLAHWWVEITFTQFDLSSTLRALFEISLYCMAVTFVFV